MPASTRGGAIQGGTGPGSCAAAAGGPSRTTLTCAYTLIRPAREPWVRLVPDSRNRRCAGPGRAAEGTGVGTAGKSVLTLPAWPPASHDCSAARGENQRFRILIGEPEICAVAKQTRGQDVTAIRARRGQGAVRWAKG